MVVPQVMIRVLRADADAAAFDWTKVHAETYAAVFDDQGHRSTQTLEAARLPHCHGVRPGVTEEPVLLGRTPNHALLVANAVQDKSHRNALVRRRR